MSLLRQGTDAEAVAGYLVQVEQEQMGLDRTLAGAEHVREVAALVLRWYAASIARWTMEGAGPASSSGDIPSR